MHGWRARLVAIGITAAGWAHGQVAYEDITAAGAKRHYGIVVPPNVPTGHAYPIVMVFHPNKTDGRAMEGVGFTPLALRDGVIVIYPDGIDHHWDGGRFVAEGKGDDIKFVVALLDALAKRYPVDPRRIFACGMSNGAIFSYTLAARLSDRIAAIATIGGELSANVVASYPPTEPVSVLAFNGTEDTFVPYGSVPNSGMLSALQTLAAWRHWDHCPNPPTILHVAANEVDQKAGLKLVSVDFDHGKNGTEVKGYVIEGGGHTWPGHDPAVDGVLGKTAQSLNATELIWAYFQAHPKPAPQ